MDKHPTRALAVMCARAHTSNINRKVNPKRSKYVKEVHNQWQKFTSPCGSFINSISKLVRVGLILYEDFTVINDMRRLSLSTIWIDQVIPRILSLILHTWSHFLITRLLCSLDFHCIALATVALPPSGLAYCSTRLHYRFFKFQPDNYACQNETFWDNAWFSNS